MSGETLAGEPLLSLDRRYLKVVRIGTALSVTPLVAAAAGLDAGLHAATGLPYGGLAGLGALAAIAIAFTTPGRRYRAWGYRLDGDELSVARGLLIRRHSVVPLQRIQHIDVAQGPIDRRFGLAALVVHTAGSSEPAVTLPGLALADAEAMRDTIRAHIRREE